jgi:hypothetical protein
MGKDRKVQSDGEDAARSASARRERLAAALRANLRRRKAQGQGRTEQQATKPDAGKTE